MTEFKRPEKELTMDDQTKGAFDHLEKIISHNYTNMTKTLDKLENKIELHPLFQVVSGEIESWEIL